MTASIRPLESADYPAFFAYLDAQLAVNGKEGHPLFQPVSRDTIHFPSDKEATFVAGLGRSLDQAGWRRAWLAVSEKNIILGHVDLRALPESGVNHRALLGMGVASGCRRRGVGQMLLNFAMDWMRDEGSLQWLDIEVLAVNTPAVAFYQKSGFTWLCEIEDMFRVDGQPEAVIRMTRHTC